LFHQQVDLRHSPAPAPHQVGTDDILLELGLDTLDETAVRSTLGVVLKHASDHERAVRELRLRAT